MGFPFLFYDVYKLIEGRQRESQRRGTCQVVCAGILWFDIGSVGPYPLPLL